ncbi:MAG: PqqD family peptide modification chaperone [Acidimicrobiia bacterium]
MAGTERGRVELIAESAVVRHNPRAEYRGLDEGGLLTQLDTGQHHGLNPVGALIWSLIDGQTFAELVERVRAEVVEPPGHLAEDMAEFIEALRKRQLIDLSLPS